MEFTFNAYAIVLLACGFSTIILSNFIYNRGGVAVKWFILLMLANSIWSITYSLELASTTLSQIKLFISLEYFGVAVLPLAWFFFCLNFSGKDCWYKKPRNFILVSFIPAVTLILVWTNDYHHFLYKRIGIDLNSPFPLADLTSGPWYYIFVSYFYILLACGCYLLINKFRLSDPIYRNQNISILIAAFIPWAANAASLLGVKPMGHIDITPFAFVLTTLFILIGIYRFKLFDIIPIARDKVIELMEDGFFVLDQRTRIIDFNRAVLRYITLPDNSRLIGASLNDIFPDQQELFDQLFNKRPGKIELTLTINNQQLFLEADILFLHDSKFHNDFSILKLQDLTSVKKDAIFTRDLANELSKLNQLKDRIFSVIAHDLRGPLVNLSEVLKMISNDQITTEEFKNIAPTLSKDIIYTTDLLENILHWSRSQLKGFGLKKEFFNLRNLIINEINYHLPAANTKKIKIIHDVFPSEMVYADMLMIQIVVRNILNNAIKFCNAYCEIHITAVYQPDGKMLVCIEDNGIGISKSVLSKLFKGENFTTRGTSNERGTGLGLMICKDFMTRNDGDIMVSSTEGEGTKFCITLTTAS
jgi:signal transduction histidine kinase